MIFFDNLYILLVPDFLPRFRIKRLPQRHVHLHRAGGRGLCQVDGLVHEARRVPLGIGVRGIDRKLERALGVRAVQVALADGLPVELVNPFGRAVGGENYQRNLLEKSFGHGRRVVQAGGS